MNPTTYFNIRVCTPEDLQQALPVVEILKRRAQEQAEQSVDARVRKLFEDNCMIFGLIARFIRVRLDDASNYEGSELLVAFDSVYLMPQAFCLLKPNVSTGSSPCSKVELLATAYWNIGSQNDRCEMRVRGAATSLIAFSSQRGNSMGTDGTLKLKALDSATGFYRDKLGFESPAFWGFRLTPMTLTAQNAQKIPRNFQQIF